MSLADNAGREMSSTYREMANLLIPFNSAGEKQRADLRCYIPEDEIAMHYATKWLKDWELELINGERVKCGFPELVRLAGIGNGKFKKVYSLGEKIRLEHEVNAKREPVNMPEISFGHVESSQGEVA